MITSAHYIFALVLLSCSTLTFSQTDDDCPFTDGSCPVTLDNVVDVFFHDIADRRSCQRYVSKATLLTLITEHRGRLHRPRYK
jgi:hypothetical protein